ncbi:DUF4123 domain-containing protein [Achromobacter aegrifaciens]
MLDYQTFSAYGFGLIQDERTGGVPAFVQAEALVPPALRKMPGLMPRLVDLSAMQAADKAPALASLNQALLDGEDLWLGLLLQADRPAEAVAAHLRSRMVVDIAGQGPCFFRFFDPRVLIQLPWMLDPAQLAWLCGPVQRFVFHLDGEWRAVERPDAAAAARPRLSEEQSFALTQVQALNEVLSGLDTLEPDGRIALGQAVMAHFRTARELGLESAEERKAFARHALAVHPAFHRHERVRACLAAMRPDDDHPYLAAVQDLSDEDWSSVRAEMERTGEPDGR